MPKINALFVLILSSFALMSVNSYSIDLEEGVHYDVVSAGKSAKKQVKEYFNYGCGGCYKSEALADMIKVAIPKDAKFNYVPFENHPSWKIYVEAYYIADMLGITKEAHKAIFHQVHVEKKAIPNKDALKELFVKLGADEKRFDQAANSFMLNSKVSKAREEAKQHKILSTPTFVVNDHYRINSRAFKTNNELIDAVNELINR
ncbi:thiol:disulfide interchange protein DsbA/DsbL [Pleionea sediminis]|uniref:thiol:disulfide interchange protein DsbA/DsbL n=1 Tax=Pleionea sediminis TaxID=2569479 RepID=UPI0011864D19|nr:thiol:disulfide interchange protein DsbA/DsbL [Pleionea sediminis]